MIPNPESLSNALLEALPDLVLLVRRDGVLLAYGGGHALPSLRPNAQSIGKPGEAVWPPHVAEVIQRLAHRAIAQRASTEATFHHLGDHLEARVHAQGPDRALCVVRRLTADSAGESLESTDIRRKPRLDRRGFLRRYKDSMALAALREKPAAVAIIEVEGLSDIAQAFDSAIAEQLMSAAILRLAPAGTDGDETSTWYLGQLKDNLLALVLQTADRDAIEACLSQLCAALREPIGLGDAAFHLTPYVGVAILGEDATSPKALLNHARAAAAEARRAATRSIHFFTDTLRLRSLARLDMARELREAITNGDIRLRYVGRHDLSTGRRVAWVGYLRWIHPARGEVRPAEFLRVAETTGLATALSRTILARLQEDIVSLAPPSDPGIRISIGALRHHILHDAFAADIARLLSDGAVSPRRFELRIAEKTFISLDSAVFSTLRRLGVRLVVDEVARGMGSLDRLTRAPLWGLQLDRSWVTTLCEDEIALKVCRAGIAMSRALGLTPVATGVDRQAQRDALLDLGCRYGSGDLYQDASADIMSAARAADRA